MTQAILKHHVSTAVYRVVQREAERYLSHDLAELYHVDNTIDRTQRIPLRDWIVLSEDLTNALAQVVEDPQDIAVRMRLVNRILVDMEQLKRRYKSDRRILQAKRDDILINITEGLEDFVTGLRSSEVKTLLVAEPNVVYSQPLIGNTTMPMVEVLERTGRYYKEGPLRDIRANPTSLIDWRREVLVYPELPPYEEHGVIFDVVKYISDLYLRTTKTLERFVTLLESALSIVVQLEIAIPDTEQDALIAEAVDICSDNHKRHTPVQTSRISAIARRLGIKGLESTNHARRCELIMEFIQRSDA